MTALLLDVHVVDSPEALGQQVIAAASSLQRGDRAGAERSYRSVLAANPRHPSTWVNLAALAIGLGKAGDGRMHAQRVLAVDAGNPHAWLNFGVASWHANQHHDAERALVHALKLAPAMEMPALNLAKMWQGIQRYDLAQRMLDAALEHNPGSSRLHQARAEIARLSADADGTRRHAVRALAALVPTLVPRRGEPAPQVDADALETGREHMCTTMAATCDRLTAAGIAHHLIGGVVLGIGREGEPFHGDKDIDLNLPRDADRDRIAQSFADGFTLIRVPNGRDARRWCMGFTDDATGIGVDLFFCEPAPDGGWRQSIGWPDHLLYDYPPCEIGTLGWRGRDWPVPVPLPRYLASNYGDDWRSPRRAVGARSFDKRWFDTLVSCPGLVAESVPRAINLVLLRLLFALRQGQWEKALALSDQILVRDSIAEVEATRDCLLAAGIG